VNAVSEQLLEQLEEYLDGALAPDEVERLNARLANDPALADALDELRAEREVRAVVWHAIESRELEARALADRIITTAHRNDRRDTAWTRVGRYAQFGSAAAACLMLGLFFGWLGHDHSSTAGPNFSSNAPTVRQVSDGGPMVSEARRPELGVLINEIRFHAPGKAPMPMLVVGKVLQNSASAGTGLRAGDVLLSVDGQPVSDMQSLLTTLGSGQGTRALRVLRDHQVRELSIQIQQ